MLFDGAASCLFNGLTKWRKVPVVLGSMYVGVPRF